MGRTAKLEGIEQEAELGARLFLINTQHTEHTLLGLFVMDTDGTTAQLGTIQDHVVGP